MTTIITQSYADYINRLENCPEDAIEYAVACIRANMDYGDLLSDEERQAIYDAGGDDTDIESLEQDTANVMGVVSDLLIDIIATKRSKV